MIVSVKVIEAGYPIVKVTIKTQWHCVSAVEADEDIGYAQYKALRNAKKILREIEEAEEENAS